MAQIWIMTIPTTEMKKHELLFRLRRRAKRWQFGIEVGANSGYEHYQVRYECSNGDYEIERSYWQGVKCELQQAGGWSEYECKDGNFYTSMDDCLGKYRFARLKELQYAILAHGRKQGDRKITIVCDPDGGTGKTFLARMRDLNGQGYYIDGTDTANIIRNIFDVIENVQQHGAYTLFIDLSRCDRLGNRVLGRLETLKNGYLSEPRYSYRRRWISPPTMFVFTNGEPDWKGLTKDRWDKIFLKRLETGDIQMWDRDKTGNPRIRVFQS